MYLVLLQSKKGPLFLAHFKFFFLNLSSVLDSKGPLARNPLVHTLNGKS